MKLPNLFRREKPKAPEAPGSDLVAACGLFDAAWYIEANPDVAQSGLAPLAHYMDHGAAELRDPGPKFDAKQYSRMHSDDPAAIQAPLLHYLRAGGGPDGYVGSPGRSAKVALEVLSKLARLDPDFTGLENDIGKFRIAFIGGAPQSRAGRVWHRLFASLERSYERVVFVPWLIRGGADLVAVHAARAVMERHGPESLLFVATDSGRMDARDWLPTEAHVRVLSDFDPDLTHQDRVEIVAWLIQALEPSSILNVNSGACWEAISTKGAALSSFCDLYATLFCRDYDIEGAAAGYADRYLRSTLPHLKAIFFDNAAFVRDLTEQFALPKSLRTRLRVVYQPVQGIIRETISAVPPHEPMPALWAGRLCRQKNVELLINIAREASSLAYGVFGAGDADYDAMVIEASRSLPNLTYHGGFASFSDLPTDRFSAFLYTTHWDGLPNVLLSAAAAGLPIIAPAIGGIGELIDDDTGWLITDIDNPRAYVHALSEIRRKPVEAARRAELLRERILTRHSWPRYMESMSIAPSFLSS